jgi:hypothetical protein
MRIFDLLLCAGLILLAGFVVRLDLQEARSVTRLATATANPQGAPAALRALAGLDRQGNPTDKLPLRAKYVAVFVIHGSKFQSDVALWNHARELYPSAEFAGVCDNASCGEQVTAAPGKLNFSPIMMGDYYAMRWLLRADARGRMMVLDRESGGLHEVDSPKSPGDLAGLNSTLPEGQ